MSPPRIARVIAVFRPPCDRPARARCCGGGAHSLARSRARGVAVAVEVAVGCTARQAPRTRRASRAHMLTSLPISVPPAHNRHARAAAAAALARSLDRSIARTRCGVGGGGGGQLYRASRASQKSCVSLVTRARAHIATASQAPSPFFRPPRAQLAHACCSGGGASAIARSLDRANAVWRWL